MPLLIGSIHNFCHCCCHSQQVFLCCYTCNSLMSRRIIKKVKIRRKMDNFLTDVLHFVRMMINGHVTATHAYLPCGMSKMVASIAQKLAHRILSSEKSLLWCKPMVFASLQKRENSYGNLLQGDTVRIGCASGFWGDSMVAGLFTCLREITMQKRFNIISFNGW